MRNTEGANIQSVSRAVTSLELIAEAGELGVTELGRRLGVHKATASRLASTLAEHGLIERDPATDKYRLGFALIHLADTDIKALIRALEKVSAHARPLRPGRIRG